MVHTARIVDGMGRNIDDLGSSSLCWDTTHISEMYSNTGSVAC